MNYLNLVKALERVAHQISKKIEYPNYGGCAVIAAVVGKAVSHHTQVQVLVQNSCERADIRQVRNTISDPFDKLSWEIGGVDFRHVLLKIKIDGAWKVFDSDGFTSYKSTDYNLGTMTVEEAAAVAAEDSWNWMFDRDQIPMIEEIVEKAFAKV